MYQFPESYLEARQVLHDSVHDDMFQYQIRTTRLKAAVAAALTFGVSCLISAFNHDPKWIAYLAPTVIGVGISFLFPNVGLKRVARSIDDESFFKDKSQKEVILLAKEYVRNYNQYEHLKNKGK